MGSLHAALLTLLVRVLVQYTACMRLRACPRSSAARGAVLRSHGIGRHGATRDFLSSVAVVPGSRSPYLTARWHPIPWLRLYSVGWMQGQGAQTMSRIGL